VLLSREEPLGLVLVAFLQNRLLLFRMLRIEEIMQDGMGALVKE
jgi:hypothetical protein